MIKNFFILASIIFSINVFSQTEQDSTKEGFEFKVVKENPITSVKNQNRTSTCWSFSGMGFLESELLRLKKGEYNLSEMFIVYHTMLDRAVNYIRLHGSSSFAPGGVFNDVVSCMKNYGLVPQEAMPGINYGDSLHVHSELDAVAGAFVDAIAKSTKINPSKVWQTALSKIYQTYLGDVPSEFNYKGKKYTPKSFLNHLGLNPDDYVPLTSFTHHPFYSKFWIEVEDNWRSDGLYWNIPIDELMEVMDNAINKGYTIAWGGDVSEDGFSRDGIAVLPDINNPNLDGSDMARWLKLSEEEKNKEITTKPCKEKTVTQETRQEEYNNWKTTDDHGMLIYGIAKDQTGKEYYMVKNSWGTKGKYKGIWYMSKTFIKAKTMDILINKNAIPKNIAKKLGIK